MRVIQHTPSENTPSLMDGLLSLQYPQEGTLYLVPIGNSQRVLPGTTWYGCDTIHMIPWPATKGPCGHLLVAGLH